MGQFSQQVSVQINHDWAGTKRAVDKLKWVQQNLETDKTGSYQTNFDLHEYGMLSKHNNTDWYMGHSGIVAKTMPWIDSMLESFKDLKPVGYWVGSFNGPVDGHLDNLSIQSALNYIIECEDTNASTWIKHKDLLEEYPSLPGTAWILNAQRLHGIKNTGKRWTLSVRFNLPYDEVKAWFDSHPNLVFGN